ncbi:hypothetical protein CMO85_02300 [Candidatus Woesearchaeota archaeon]|nr:hypothetical protein [Candidatus Woesearchaeota archaeon]
MEETRVEGFFVLLRKQIAKKIQKKNMAWFDPPVSTGKVNDELKDDREIDEENRIEKNPFDMLARST